MSSIVLFLASTAALAVAPTAETRSEPQRVRWEHGETQGLLHLSPAWKRFATGEGTGWQARFDETTGTPRWMWGKGIPIAGRTEAAVLRDVRALLERHRALLGFEALDDGVARYDGTVDTWYVGFAPLRDGTPTYRGAISARIKHGNLILLTVTTAPDAPVRGEWALSADDATRAAIARGPAPSAAHIDLGAVRQLLERQGADGLALERTWMVTTRTAEPPGIWVSFVSADTGELLHVHNALRFLDGTVTGLHHARSPEVPASVTSPMPFVFVASDTDIAEADAQGSFSVIDGAPYLTDLQGEHVGVVNAAGGNGTLSGAGPELHWTSDDATQAEIDTYVFAHQVRVWGERVGGQIPVVTEPMIATVNANDVCNAFYDPLTGDTTFYAAGGGCNNMGENADVVYHEWGHGFHYSIVQGGVIDGAVSEAAGDTVATFQTRDSVIAPFFVVNGQPVRDVGPDRVWPDDVYGEVHEDGLIFGGAMWDLWEMLRDDLGDEAGTLVAEDLFAGILRGGPAIPDTYYEALVADDDDGDLQNGTPHVCLIHDAFARHGLTSVNGYLTSHEPLVFVPEGVPATVDVTLLPIAAACTTAVPDEAVVYFRVDGGPWDEVAATVTGFDASGDIPAQALGAFVEYWIRGEDTEGGVWQVPYSGEWAPYTYFSGGVIPIACEDFEADDGGFVHTLLAGEPAADDWQWGAPTGTFSDPGAAYSGTNVWGTDLGLAGADGRYVPNMESRLTSATFDTAWYTDVFLQYRRWLTVEDRFYDRALVTANGAPVWQNHDSGNEAGGQHHHDEQWVSHVVDLQGIADQTQVALGWELRTDGGLELGGWNIDDVCLYAPATPDNRLAIVDFTVEDVGGPIALSWTNPVHAPVDEVIVVRRTDDWPQSETDGDVVATIADPVPGEAVAVVHDNVDGASGYYAVYASDGVAWLSWTLEGWNAAHADPNEGSPGDTDAPVDTDAPDDTDDPGAPADPDAPGKDEGGCGCATSGPSGALALVPVLGLLWRRRRARLP